MDEPEEHKIDDLKQRSSEAASEGKNKNKTKSSSSAKTEDDDGTISEGSISEHIVSISGGSVENDRSFQEIEIANETSGVEERTLTPLIHQKSMEKSTSNASGDNEKLSNGEETTDDDVEINKLPKSTTEHDSSEPQLELEVPNSSNSARHVAETKISKNSNESVKNSKSILEELLGVSDMQSATLTKDETFNLFANIDLSDKSLLNISSLSDKDNNKSEENIEKKMKKLEESLAVKDSTINALAQELDSLRELSNPTINTSSSLVSATEYKQLQEECQEKWLEYNNAIVYKNQLIQQLSESLDQSVSERKDLISQIKNFKIEMAEIQMKLKDTTKMAEKHVDDKKVDRIDTDVVGALEKEISYLKEKIRHDKEDYVNEVGHLRELIENIKCGSTELAELKDELDKKHAKEVEELRLYFERKCADLEKNYSEEIFSQQSRKLSDSISDLELSNDFLSTNNNNNQPGPGGDFHSNTPIFNTKINYKKFKNTLETLLNKITPYSTMDDDSDEKQMENLENEARSELNSLIKIAQQFEVRAIEKKYMDEIVNLRNQLEEAKKDHGNLSISSIMQEGGDSGDFEIANVIDSYERRLQEQVNLARIDIINELVAQIERFASDSEENEEWPTELLELREKFACKYKNEIKDLNEKHQNEIKQLKDQLKMGRKYHKSDDYSITDGQELIQERDNLKKEVISLHNLLTELVTYFTQAEDALNTTLIDELLKQNGVERNSLAPTLNEDELNFETSATTTTTTNSMKILDFSDISNATKVRLTPNFKELLHMVGKQNPNKDESVDQDISVDLVKHELSTCLAKLRQDANTILALTNDLPKICKHCNDRDQFLGDEQVAYLSKQIKLEIEQKERLKQELKEATDLIEKQRTVFDKRTDELLDRINILESDLNGAKCKIAELLETGHKEVVSEGYGDGGEGMLSETVDADTLLSNLQEAARTMLTQSRASADANTLQIMEEFCRVGEKLREDAKREKAELLQQIEAADKKYKTTQKFLEEQAFEREQERDDAQKKIKDLYDMLKERDRDRANCEIMLNEAHHLENQLSDLTQQLQEEHLKYLAIEKQRDEAHEKVRVLREIIRELENQNDVQKQRIDEQLCNIEKLQCIIQQQHGALDEFKLLTDGGNVSDLHGLRRHIEELEEELQKLRIESELAGSEGVTKQIKLQLFELEVNLDKKIKELELLPSIGSGVGLAGAGGGTNSCSSPSEDMSVRDVVRPQTSNSSAMDECEVPLQQLARLKEKLMRHSRAEEAALKRIRDLEMEVFTLKNIRNELEENQNEKECMKRQIQDYLVLISDLQIRLDEQRIKAEHIEKQTNTSLESKIYNLQEEIVDLQEKLKSKDKTLQHQEEIIKATQQRCKDLENDLATDKNGDDKIIVEMQKELETVRKENRQMKDRLSNDNQILPNLVESIIADKNADIEQLRCKLSETEKQLYNYKSLDLNNIDLKLLANLKHSGGSIEQLISILDLSQQQSDCVRRIDTSKQHDDLFSVVGIPFKHIGDETPSLPDDDVGTLEPEISSIERIVPRNFQLSMGVALGKQNSTERSLEKRVHFEEAADNEDQLVKQIHILKEEIATKTRTIEENEMKLKALNDLENKISILQQKLDETEQLLANVTNSFAKEDTEAKEREQQIRVELAEKKVHLYEMEQENETLNKDSKRKDEMCTTLAREKKELEKELVILKKNKFDDIDKVVNEKNDVINQLEYELANLNRKISYSDADLKKINDELSQAKKKFEKALLHKENENSKLQKDLKNKIVSLDTAQFEIRNLKETLLYKETLLSNYQEINKDNEAKLEEFDTMKQLLRENERHINGLKSDIKYYQSKIDESEETVKTIQKELDDQIAYYGEVIKEKDNIIAHMNDQHNEVTVNLQSIKEKLNTTGNIFDLVSRLKKEQKTNAELFEEIHSLKAKLMNYEITTNSANVDEITAPLKKELECASEIDSSILNAVNEKSFNLLSESQDAEIYRNSLLKAKIKNKNLRVIEERLLEQIRSLEEIRDNLEEKVSTTQDVLDNERTTVKKMVLEYDKYCQQINNKHQMLLKRQNELELILHHENQVKITLEAEVEELKKCISACVEATKFNSLPPQSSYHQSKIDDLQKHLDTEKHEKTQLNDKLRYLIETNSGLENNIKYTKELLRLELERTKAYEEKLRMKNERERKLKDELSKHKTELEQARRQIEEKNNEVDDLDQQRALLENQKANLLETLKAQSSLIPSLENGIPPTLSDVVKELNDKNNENAQRLLCVERVEKENQQLKKEINFLKNMSTNDLIARNDYLFAKSLKLESVGRALIWQKQYLLNSLKNPLKCGVLLGVELGYITPQQRFKSIGHAIIAIARMKYLVKRWHSGKRNLDKINARHYEKPSQHRYVANQDSNGSVANFQIGQPFLGQHYLPNVSEPTRFQSNLLLPQQSINNNVILPQNYWSHQTPPSQDVRDTRIESDIFYTQETPPPLRMPHLLGQFTERHAQLEDKLGVPYVRKML